MPFGTLTHGSLTFEPRQDGIYMLSTAVIGDPLTYIQFRPNSTSGNLIRLAVSAIAEKDVEVSGANQRFKQTWTLSGVMPNAHFSPAEAVALVDRLNTIYTQAVLSRHALGEI